MRTVEWTELFGLMAERFGRDPSPELAAWYLEKLEKSLSDDQIRVGVDRVMGMDTYFPGPARIVEVVEREASVEALALEAWSEIIERRDRPKEFRPSQVSKPARKALTSIGGIHALAGLSATDALHARRAFLGAFEVYHDDADQLPGSDELPRIEGDGSLTRTGEVVFVLRGEGEGG